MAGNTEEDGLPVGAPAAQGQVSRSASDSGQATAASSPRMITSEELLCGGAEVVIRHAGENYRLRRTSKGKLILTK